MKKGQVLVEIVVAIAVAVIALLAISRVSSQSINNAGSAARQNTAKNYAQAAVDKARYIKDVGGLAAITSPKFDAGYHCFDGTNIADAVGDYCLISGTEYEGRVNMSRTIINSKIELTAVSEIRWVEGNLTRTVSNEIKLVLDQ